MPKLKVLMLETLPYMNSGVQIGSHHYATLFSQHYEVLWVSLPWHPIQLLRGNCGYVKNWNFNRPFFDGRLFSFTPFTPFPYRDHFALKTEWHLKNYQALMPGLYKTVKNLGFHQADIVWLTEPRHYSLAKLISPEKFFYRCVDDYEQFQDIPAGLVQYEKELMRRADAVFFTSKELQKKFDGLNDRSVYLPNGCDYDFFARGVQSEANDEIRKFFLPDKINVLYIGAIADWFDFDALRQIAMNRRYHCVIVGPIRCEVPADLLNQNNVQFTGPYNYQFMPNFTSLAQVGIIPFKVNQITNSVNPIKLYEYSAAGLPTVSSNFKTVTEIKGPHFVYESLLDMQDMLAAAAQAGADPVFKETIRLFARKNSWEERFSEILARLSVGEL